MCCHSWCVSPCDGDHRHLHVLTHSFPTRRSSDLPLRIVATHLGLRPAERRDQIRRLLQEFDTSEMPVIMLGDVSEWFVRSAEHTSELQSLMRISYAVFCLSNITTPANRPLMSTLILSRHE